MIGTKPSTLDDLIGRKEAVKKLQEALAASKRAKILMDHTLIVGPAGVGKTTTARCLLKSMRVNSISLTLKRPTPINNPEFDDLLHRIQKEKAKAIFFDELCRLPSETQGKLSRLMPFLPFTVVGATTRPDWLLPEFVGRFPIQLKFTYFKNAELLFLLQQRIEGLPNQPRLHQLEQIVRTAKGSPRRALGLLAKLMNGEN